jgi:hypothetical protein
VSTLEWAFSLDGQLPYDCILSLGDGIKHDPIIGAARKLFRDVTVLESNADDSWPLGKNQTFQNLVRHLDDKRSTDSFFWWEPDCVFTKKGALKTIEEAHISGGKPFSGYVHESLQQMECVGVYPYDFMRYSPRNGMGCRAAPWDQCMRYDQLMGHTHRLNHIIQFVHDVDGFPPTFPKDSKLLNKDAVLFHASKDGALIEQLSKGKIHKLIQLFKSEKPAIKKQEHVSVYLCLEPLPPFLKNGEQGKAVLAISSNAPSAVVGQWVIALSSRYTVTRFMYPAPKGGQDEFKWARKQVEEYMAKQTEPWVFA